MRSTIFAALAAALLMVGVVAAVGAQRNAALPLAPEPPVRVVPEVAVEEPPVAQPAAEAVVASDPPATQAQAPAEAQPAPQPRWRSHRNRYPAPSWTPDQWAPPEGPVKIALQAGHWRADEAPRELNGLRYGGTHAVGLAEWEVNLAIAERTAVMLTDLGYEVEILPAVVPPDYLAHLFIAIHADGADDTRARGYRIAAPDQDYTGRSGQIVKLMRETYGEATGIRELPDVTRRMRRYYAFNVRRYEHSLDPRTIALILETGFLTSPTDREVIVDDPDRAARGIVDAVKAFSVTSLEQVAAAASPATPEASATLRAPTSGTNR